MNTDKNIQELWDLYISDQASPEQVNRLFEYIRNTDDEQNTAAFREAIDRFSGALPKADKTAAAGVLETIINADETLRDQLSEAPVVHQLRAVRSWRWVAAAAILVLVAGLSWWQWGSRTVPAQLAVKDTTVAPGHNGAILTLADGSQVELDSAGNGVVAKQNGVSLVIDSGKLAYKPAGNAGSEMVYNTMTTPKGRQFRLSLPDGTQVWLNAASSITYPVAFTGNERVVKITGEAYFEVAIAANQPFKVSVGNKATIQVLGTSFNISAYSNEPDIKATLIEGRVRVAGRQNQNAVILNKGQQAKIAGLTDKNDEIKIVEHADLNQVLAWKNGLFNFESASLEQVMKQLERWYDIEVVYENGVPDIPLMGEMTRGVPLDDLLNVLKKMGMHYRREGRKLVILK